MEDKTLMRDKQYLRRKSKSSNFVLDMSDHYSREARRRTNHMRSTIDSSASSFNHHPRRASVSQCDGIVNHQSSPSKQSKKLSATKEPKTKVINLHWMNNRGVQEHYSGEVNVLIQPHWCGSLIYINGKTMESIWNNGMPIQDDRHHPFLEKMSTLLNPSPHHKPHHSPSSTKKLSHVSHFRTAFPHLPFQPRPRVFDLGDIVEHDAVVVGGIVLCSFQLYFILFWITISKLSMQVCITQTIAM